MYILGVLSKLVVVVFLFVGVIKLAPVYHDEYSVKKTLDVIEKRYSLEKDASVGEVNDWLNQGFQVNNVPDLITRSVMLQRRGTTVFVDVNYERRIPIIDDVDLVLTFRNHRTLEK